MPIFSIVSLPKLALGKQMLLIRPIAIIGYRYLGSLNANLPMAYLKQRIVGAIHELPLLCSTGFKLRFAL